MTHQEILTKAIQKAIEGGWDMYYQALSDRDIGVEHIAPLYMEDPYTLIFNHDFAKALWGEDLVVTCQHDSGFIEGKDPAWMAHLMAMVIADDPIEYLGKNL